MLNSTLPRLGVVKNNPTPPPPCTLHKGYGGVAALLMQLQSGSKCVQAQAVAALDSFFKNAEHCVAAYKAGKLSRV